MHPRILGLVLIFLCIQNIVTEESGQANTAVAGVADTCSPSCDWCDKQPPCVALTVNSTLWQLSFSGKFAEFMSTTEVDKELWQMIGRQQSILGPFLNLMHPLSDCVMIRKVFRLLQQMGFTKIPEIMQQFGPLAQGSIALDIFVLYTDLIGSFSDESLKRVIRLMSQDALRSMCKNVMHEQFSCRQVHSMMKAMKSNNKSCLMFQNLTMPKDIVYEALFWQYGKPETWNEIAWGVVLDQYKYLFIESADLYKILKGDILKKMLPKIMNFCGEMEATKQKKLIQNMKDAFRNISVANAYQTEMQLMFVRTCGGDVSEILNKQQIVQKYEPGDSATMSTRQIALLGKDILEVLNKTLQNYTVEEIIKYADILVQDSEFLWNVNKNNLEEAVCKLGAMEDFPRPLARKLKNVIRKRIERFKQIALYDWAELYCLKHILAVFNKAEINLIQNSLIFKAFIEGFFKDIKFTCQVGNFTTDELKKFGVSLSCFTNKDWKNISSNQLTDDIIVTVADAYEKHVNVQEEQGKTKSGQMNGIAELAKGRDGATDKIYSTSLGQHMPSSGYATGHIIGEQLKEGKADILECKCEQAKGCWKGLTDILGEDLSDWDPVYIKKLSGAAVWSGMSLDKIKNLPVNLLANYSPGTFTSNECSSSKQFNHTMTSRHAVQESCGEPIPTQGSLTEDQASDSVPNPVQWFFKQVSDLEKFDSDTRHKICDAMAGVDDVSQVPLNKISEKLGLCPHCTPDIITVDIYETCKPFMCGLSINQIKTLNKLALEKYAIDLCQRCHWNKEMRTALVDRCMKTGAVESMVSNFNEIDMCTLGSCMKTFTQAQLINIPDETVSNSLECVRESSQKRSEESDKRQAHGDIPSKEEESEEVGENKVYGRRVLDAYHRNEQLHNMSTINRRRRAVATSLTCDDLTAIGSQGLIAMTEAEISALGDLDVIDCLSMLGAVASWSSAQKQALLAVLKRDTVLGQCGQWTSDKISSAGNIVQGMTVDDIRMLQLDLDAIEALGQYDGWTETQKMEVFNRFLSYYKNSQLASDLTAQELRILGHFTCGMTTDQIASISYEKYRNASDAIGKVTSCSESQLIEWAKLAKMAFGDDVSTWGVAIIESVGTVLGGLTKDDIPKLSEDQIDSINPVNIAYIPPSTFQKFTPDQLWLFSLNQAQATTSAQLSALSSDQLGALAAIAGSSLDFNGFGKNFGKLELTVELFNVIMGSHHS